MSEKQDIEKILVDALINTTNNRFERVDVNMTRVKDNLFEQIIKVSDKVDNLDYKTSEQYNSQLIFCLTILALYLIHIVLFVKFF